MNLRRRRFYKREAEFPQESEGSVVSKLIRGEIGETDF